MPGSPIDFFPAILQTNILANIIAHYANNRKNTCCNANAHFLMQSDILNLLQ